MKPLIKSILVLFLIIKPLLIGFSQIVSPPANASDSSHKIAELQNKLDAKLQAVNVAIDAIDAKQKAAVQKPKAVVKKKTVIKEIIVYRDTCLPHAPDQPIIDSVQATIETPRLTVVKKIKWYHFKQLRKHKREERQRKKDEQEPEN